jgi:hypothetical protein
VIKSPENPDSEISSWEKFHEIRQSYQDQRPSFKGRDWETWEALDGVAG